MLTDSKSTNNYTLHGSITEDTTNFKEGSCALQISSGSGYLTRSDGDLATGFPLKSGDTTKKFSACAWIRPTSQATWRFIFGKTNYFWGSGGSNCFHLSRNSKRLYVGWGIVASPYNVDYDTGIDTEDNEWYHVGIAIDGIAKTLSVRVYRVSNSTVYTYSGTPAEELAICSVLWGIGLFADWGGNYWEGQLDELVIFNRVLSDAEIDEIRSGTFS